MEYNTNSKYQLAPIDVMRYFLNYHDYEQQLLHELQNNPVGDHCLNLFKRYKNAYMRVGRNFGSKKDNEILELLVSLSNDFDNVEDLSKLLKEKNLLIDKIDHAIVASSKFLWLKNQETIIIDNVNSKHLKSDVKNYKDYRLKWKEEFEKTEADIIHLIDNYFDNAYFAVMKNRWFRMRVFDQYLWKLEQ